MVEISEKLVDDIREMAAERESLKKYHDSVKGISDIFFKDTIDELYGDILEFLPEDLMEKVVVKFDKRMTEFLDKLEKLEEAIGEDDIGNSAYYDDIAEKLDWAKLSIDKSVTPPLR